MAYEKYIKKNGKIYGPYVYQSKRVNGKVVSEYQGSQKKKKKLEKKNFIAIFALISIFFLVLAYNLFLSPNLTGHSIIEIEENIRGDIISGELILSLKGGELIPKESIITIENYGKNYTYKIEDILKNYETNTGNFYLEDKEINLTGEGYGKKGIKETITPVFFKLEILKEKTSSSESEEENKTEEETETIPENKTEEKDTEEKDTEENETIVVPEENLEETTNEITEASKEEETIITTEENIETETESVPEIKEETDTNTNENTEESAIITGNIISNIFSEVGSFFSFILTGRAIDETEIIQGDVKKGEKFEYDLDENSYVSIIPGSVQTEFEQLEDSQIELELKDGKAIVSTSYSIKEEGYGEEFLNENETKYIVNLEDLGIALEEGKVKVTINYENESLIEYQKDISIEEISPLEEETENETIEKIIEEMFNETNATSDFENISLTNEELQTLKNIFPIIVINISSKEYKDKILTTFSLGDYKIENSYDKNLEIEKIKELIERDKILWLKDLANKFSSTKTSTKERNDLSETIPII